MGDRFPRGITGAELVKTPILVEWVNLVKHSEYLLEKKVGSSPRKTPGKSKMLLA